MRIQHNIPAMTSYRHYSNNNKAVSKNLEKLSSGFRINRAGDDAAGLAISEKMRIQITGLEQAQSNAKSGINLIQTAEGAMTEVHDMLKRMYTLAEQSANGTYSDELDREQLQKEVNSLRTEINRIADSTNYNGINLLDGSMERKTVATGTTNIGTKNGLTITYDGQRGSKAQAGVFQVDFSRLEIYGGTSGVTPTFSIFGESVALDAVATNAKVTAEDVAAQIATKWNDSHATTDFCGTTIRASVNGSKVTFKMENAPTSKWTKVASAAFSGLDTSNHNQAQQVKVTTLTEPVDLTQTRQYAQAEFTLTEKMVGDGKTLTIGKDTYVFAVGKNSVFKDAANVIDLTDCSKTAAAAGSTSVMAKAAMRLSTVAQNNQMFKVGADTQTGKVTLTEKEGAIDYSVYDLENTKNTGSGTVNDQDGKWTGLIKTGQIDTAASTKGLTLQIGDTAESFNKMNVSVKDMHADAMGIGDIDISTQAGAAAAMDKIKAATNYVSDVRGDLGALQNRLDHTINNLSVAQENIQDAESNIRDVDIAKEMMEYTKNNILVQSAQAMLAQANQLPQGVLQLLG